MVEMVLLAMSNGMTLNGLITSQYADLNTTFIQVNTPTGGTASQSISAFLNTTFGFHLSFLDVIAVVLLIFPAFFAVMFIFCLKTLNFQRR